MQREEEGYHTHSEKSVPPGQRYAYRLDGGPERADPCSLWQPKGLQGPSAVVLPTDFEWTDHPWQGVRREDLIFYEMHVGTFSAEGTFDGVIPRLRDLVDLGITAIEIMPIGQFPGTRNWGYDGVLLYAAQHSYGGPHGLARLVDACHREGLAVFLDVIYNHFGPEGSHMAEFGRYLNDHYTTPWGEAVNFDGRDCGPVRDFVLDNARMWLEEFHCDGLRLDAVQAIFDLGARPVLGRIREIADDVASRRGWPALVVAESDLNDPRVLYPRTCGGHALDAQWADDFHHSVRAFVAGTRGGYFADFGEPHQLVKAFESPYVYVWTYSPCRGRKHGVIPEGLAGDRFVAFIQNHDQVGNSAAGHRLTSLLASAPKERLAACLLLLSPYLPLLFMGQEYGEPAPFPFFCSFESQELARGVFEGRQGESDVMGWSEKVPEPQAEATFESAKLSWSWPEGTPRAGLRRMYRDLLTARREWAPLRDFERRSARLLPDAQHGPILELVRGDQTANGSIRAVFNLGDRPHEIPGGVEPGVKLLFRSEATVYGGDRDDASSPLALGPFECTVFGRPSLQAPSRNPSLFGDTA